MAVIESKGNGFSLYGGVKLSSLPQHGKRYSFIYSHNGTTFFVAADTDFFVESASDREFCSTDVMEFYLWPVDGATFGEMQTMPRSNNAYPFDSLIWSDFDFADIDGNVVLAKSEPISLDGMNVIEWDGDTEGLLKGNKHYHVSDATDVDTSRGYVSVRLNNGITRVVYQEDAYTWKENELAYTFAYQGRIVPEANETYAAAGVWFFTTSSIITSLFAYYPIEPAEPEQPEIDRGKLFLLYNMFSPDVFYAITGKKHWAE